MDKLQIRLVKWFTVLIVVGLTCFLSTLIEPSNSISLILVAIIAVFIGGGLALFHHWLETKVK